MDFIEERAGKIMAYKSLWDKRKNQNSLQVSKNITQKQVYLL
jgi:hypothetical protein